MTTLLPPLLVAGATHQALLSDIDRAAEELVMADDLAETCWARTATVSGRWRAAVSASDAGVLRDALGVLRERLSSGLQVMSYRVDGTTTPGRARIVVGDAEHGAQPVLVFPGQGPMWPGIGNDLLEMSPDAEREFRDVTDAVSGHLGWTPRPVSVDESPPTSLAQITPFQFATAAALVELWRRVGLSEAAVIGHSVGEVAAAHACGAVTRADAALLASTFSEAYSQKEKTGAMASVAAPVEQVETMVSPWGGRVTVSATNSPRNTTVSGDADAIDALLDALRRDGLWAWRVPGVTVAGHSPHMDEVRDFVAAQLVGVGTPQTDSRSVLYTSTTGGRIEPNQLTADFWYRSLRDPVRFRDGLDALVADGHRMFVEISTHPVLTTAISETLAVAEASASGVAISTLDRRSPADAAFADAITTVWAHGGRIDWDAARELVFSDTRSGTTSVEPPAAAVAESADASDRRAETRGVENSTAEADLATLHTSGPDARIDAVVDIVMSEAERVCGERPESARTTFLDVGLRSLQIVELVSAVAARTGLILAPTLVYDHPTPYDLAVHVASELGWTRPDTIHGARTTPSPSPDSRRAHADEPIAIVGIGCRFPGGVTNADELWQVVNDGKDLIGGFPTDRGWDVEALYDPEPARPGRISSRFGGFLYDAAQFDAGFFGLSPREAASMEPQQRLLMEVCWEALEDAGIAPDTLRGSSTGVIIGLIAQEYGPRLHDAPDGVAGHAFLGSAGCVASGRVAYQLGLEGPAITIDTACSSSLVAIHNAAESLRAGECDLVLSGGATVMSTPGVLIDFSQQGVLSPDGRCKAFSAAADGIALSEGVGVVVLERLSDARAHGHRVLATVRGSAVNQDGASNGLTAPSGRAQQRLITRALATSGLDASDVDVIEAHGTGTGLGDPIEAGAILATYGAARGEANPVWLGSIKSNMGHTQAAAGVAGLIKMVQAIRHRTLPPTLHCEVPNPHIDWASGVVRVPTESQPWPNRDGKDGVRPARAAVSSFGVSGTNSHLLVEEATEYVGEAVRPTPAPYFAWPISSPRESGSSEYATALRRHVMARPDIDPLDVQHTLATGRARRRHGAVVLGGDTPELLDATKALASGRDHPRVVRGIAPTDRPGKVALVFPGQGGQWRGMGTALHDAFPAFREALEQIDATLSPMTGWSVIDVLRAVEGAPSLDRIDVVQPALFAVMVSMARLTMSFGVRPDAVVGHSQGEVAAAHIAGAIDLTDACLIVARRAQALATLSGTGGMAHVSASADKVGELMSDLGSQIDVCARNSPVSTVVSGDPGAIDTLLTRCEEVDVRARRIKADVAGHSSHMDPLHDRLIDDLSSVTPRSGTVAFYSTVRGRRADTAIDTTSLDATYWFDNLRRTIEFDMTARQLAEAGFDTFVECGPHPVLTSALSETVSPTSLVVSGMHNDRDAAEFLYAALAAVHLRGHDIAWSHGAPGGRTIALPTSPFDRERHWLSFSDTPRTSATARPGEHHPFIDTVIELPDDGGVVLTGRIDLRSHPWLADHAANGVVLAPAAAFLDMAMVAAHVGGRTRIRELVLVAPIVLDEEAPTELQIRVGPATSLTVHARVDGAASQPWTLRATGEVDDEPTAASDRETSAARGSDPQPPTASEIDVSAMRDAIRSAGYDYGPAFTGLTSAWRDGDDLLVTAELPGGLDVDGHVIHPALLDTALHPILLNDDDTVAGMRLPFAFNEVTVPTRRSADHHVRAHIVRRDPDTVGITVRNDRGDALVHIGSLTLSAVTDEQLRTASDARHADDLLRSVWSERPGADVAPVDSVASCALIGAASRAAFGGDASGVSEFDDLDSLAAQIRRGTECPDVVVWAPLATIGAAHDRAATARETCDAVRDVVQRWLSDESFTGGSLVMVTRHAMATDADDVPDPVHAAVWGMVHSAQQEHPGRIVLTDIDERSTSLAAIATVIDSGEPRTAMRDGKLLLAHLTRAADTRTLHAPAGEPLWRLDTTERGGLDDLVLIADPTSAGPLDPNGVRIEVRAAGVNFYDTVGALGLIPPQHDFGAEAAGVVLQVGSDVGDLRPGDRVMSLCERAFGPVVDVDRRTTARIPEEWTFAEAATVPVAFVTAYHSLVDLAQIQPGETVIVHAATGGVGQAATQLAKVLGAQAFATAHPRKWPVLRELGYADEAIASSRDLDFVESFREATDGRGVDVILNCLAGPFVDAGLDLLAPGGRMIELGKTDIRDTGDVARTHPDVTYAAFDRRTSASPERTQEILGELLRMVDAGDIAPLPLVAYDVREAVRAFALMRDARHIGKIVLTPPRELDPSGTVLVTGGTGVLGAILARHLVAERGVRRIVLASRSGDRAPGSGSLRDDLVALGAEVFIESADLSDPIATAKLLSDIPGSHPLTAVYHTAGVLADATVAALTSDGISTVFRPKVDAAWNLHTQTAHMDLAEFVLYSSSAGTLGNPGQSAYVAANAFLDALAHERRRNGLAATSVAWGWWETVTGMSKALSDNDHKRIARSGLAPISAEHGNALLDLAVAGPEPALVALPTRRSALRAARENGSLHPLLEHIAGGRTAPSRRAAGTPTTLDVERDLVPLPPSERKRAVRDLVSARAADVLGVTEAGALPHDEQFKSLGFDSLTSLELRNRLSSLTRLSLPASLLFDHPTVADLADHLLGQMFPDDDPDETVRDRPESVTEDDSSDHSEMREYIEAADVDELISLAMSADGDHQ